MARAAAGAYEGGTARWTPAQQHPALQPPDNTMLRLPDGGATITATLPPIIHSSVLLADRSHAELVAAARKSLELAEVGSNVAHYVLLTLLALAIAAVLYVMFILVRRMIRDRAVYQAA